MANLGNGRVSIKFNNSSAIENEDIFNVHNYSVEKNNIKKCLDFMKPAFIALLSFSEPLATKSVSLK